MTRPCPSPDSSHSTPSPTPINEPEDLKTGDMTYRLEELAFLRSGDKGNSANIGDVIIITFDPMHHV